MPQLHIAYLQLLSWVGTTSARVSIFIILLLPVLFVFQNKLRARLHYLLWCLVFTSLLLPWTPSSPISIYNLANSFPITNLTNALAGSFNPVDPTSTPVFPDSGLQPASAADQGTPGSPFSGSNGGNPELDLIESGPITVTPSNPISSVPPHEASSFGATSFLSSLLFLLWFAGMAVLAVSSLLANWRFAVRINGRPLVDPKIIAVFQTVRQELALCGNFRQGNIPLILTGAVKTPSLFGVFRPKLLLPAGVLDGLDSDQLRHIFIHELLHLKRKDILVLWLARLLLFVHWFNPLVWYAFHQLRENQELACDEAVLSRIGPNRSTAYCRTLVTLWERCSFRPALINATTLSGSGSQLKKRIALIGKFGKTSRKWTLPVILLVAVLAFISLSSALAAPTAPAGDSSPENPPANPLVQVNSTEPVMLNMDLVEKAKNWMDILEFSVAGDSDIAGIAFGRLLRFATDVTYNQRYYPEIDWEKLHPAQPLLVKSYEIGYSDYYLVPFVQNGRFAARAVVSVTNKDRTKVRFEDGGFIYPFTDRFLRVDVDRAMQLIREEKGLSEVPVPRLVFHRDLTGLAPPNDKLERASLEPAWEFVLDDGSRLYVNQEGQVLDKDVIPWYEKLATPPYHPENTVVEANKLVRDDGWSLSIEKLALSGPYSSDPFLQSIEIYCRAENNSGPDQLFMPRGTIVSITAAGGKTYPFGTLELDKTYIDIQQMRLEQNETAIKAGLLKLGMLAQAEAVDTQFSSLTYRDENGREFKIPLELTPEFIQQKPDNTLNLDPYPVPGKDWGIALNYLEFRWGDWTDKKVVFLDLAIINNQGPDQAFQPTGSITGIIGSSGKLYPDYGPGSLEEMYHGREAYFTEQGRPMYQPGVLHYAPEILVDAGEETISKVIYLDETGKKHEVPLREVKP